MHKKSNIFVIVGLLLAILSSCLKTVTNNNKNNPAGLTFFNMVPYAPDFTVNVDGTKIGDTTKFPYAYGWSTAPPTYISEYAGIHSISFLNVNDSNKDLVSGNNVQFATSTNYSVWLYDTLSSFGLNAVQLVDSWDSIPYGYCLIRFLNFSPTFSPLNVWYRFNDTGLYRFPLFTGQYFMGNTSSSAATLSAYTQFLPGAYTFYYTFTSDTTNQVYDQVIDTLLPAHAYTMYIGGLLDSTGSKALINGLVHMN